MAVILLPLLTLGILSPLISANTIENETTEHVRLLIRQVTRNIEFYVHEMEGLVSILADDPNIQSFFGLEGAGVPFTDAYADGVRRLLGTVSGVHPEIAGILLVNEHDGSLSNEIEPVTRDPLRQEPWYLSAIQSPRAIVEQFRRQGVPIHAVIALGGIARKRPLVMQVMADVLEMSIRVAASEQACALGASMFASVAAGLYSSVTEAQKKMASGFDIVFTPNRRRSAVYAKLYRKYANLAATLEKFLRTA